jgi:hypothetical protein
MSAEPARQGNESPEVGREGEDVLTPTHKAKKPTTAK